MKTIPSRFSTYRVECVEENRCLDEPISSMASYFEGSHLSQGLELPLRKQGCIGRVFAFKELCAFVHKP